MKTILLHAIRFYQRYLSFDTGILKFLFLTDKACRYQPTCSQYMYEAIERYGIIDGLSLAVKRIIRCHPWSRGGVDEVPRDLQINKSTNKQINV
ncbi:membrane protein insertion efficiency factor YidD [Candidatus Gottesmanbacteria bacterium]|nr:membrane protein insertion efficiency factor YidD [Candidatus Gottesmanbacteria bacterium]